MTHEPGLSTAYENHEAIFRRIAHEFGTHRAVIKLILPVHLMTDIHAHAAPPDFALLERGRLVLGVQLLLLAVPAWEVLLHRTCMAQNTGRVQ